MGVGSRAGASPLARFTVVALALALVFAMVPATASAAVGTPRIISPDGGKTVRANPTLAWRRVRGADHYRVQVSASRSFGTLLYNVETTNIRATVPTELPLGRLYWRVAAVEAPFSSDQGRFAMATFVKRPPRAPALIFPEDGATLRFPDNPVRFSWSALPGATSYRLEIDDAPDFIGATSVSTPNLSFTMTEPQTVGQTVYWRVQGVSSAQGVNSAWSGVRQYTVAWNSVPELISPASTVSTEITDVVLEWKPVPGAASYEVQISPNGDWANNVAHSANVKATRYSPAATLDNGAYFWRVRARDAARTPNFGAWSEERQFLRAWLDRPANVRTTTGPVPTLAWDPVPNASHYEVWIGIDENFSDGQYAICSTNQTSFTYHDDYTPPRTPSPAGCTDYIRAIMWWVTASAPDGPRQFYWRVRGVDAGPGPDRVLGVWSTVGGFSYDPAAEISGDLSGDLLPPTAYLAPTRCASTDCAAEATTPTLKWRHTAEAKSYFVYIASDRNFTNIVGTYETRFNVLTPRESLLDGQVDDTYYWFVRPCSSAVRAFVKTCGPFNPDVYENASAFRKRSRPLNVTSPADGATVANQVTFTWDEYLSTNSAAGVPQGAKAYRVEVSTVADFATVIDRVVVDQKTYTASASTYPEGPLYWRVQALDGSGNPLTFSPIRRLNKKSPAVVLTHPAAGKTVRALPYFEWQPQAYAAEYEFELYRNGDLQASPANRVGLAQRTKMSAWAPTAALESGVYAWRVRRLDVDGRPGAWSAGRKFTVAGKPAVLRRPLSGATIRGKKLLFKWRPRAGAVQYQFELSPNRSFGRPTITQRTASTAWAPTLRPTRGTYYWRVKVVDAQFRTLSTSGVRRVVIR